MGKTMNLVGWTSAEICKELTPHVDRAYRARQVARWVIDRNATTFAEMTDLPLAMRESLAQQFAIAEPEVLEVVALENLLLSLSGARRRAGG